MIICKKCGNNNLNTDKFCISCGNSFAGTGKISKVARNNKTGKKNCPYCAEEIQEAAILCKHCNSKLPGFQEKIPEETIDILSEHNPNLKPSTSPEPIPPSTEHSDIPSPWDTARKYAIWLFVLGEIAAIANNYNAYAHVSESLYINHVVMDLIIWYPLASLLIWVILAGIIWLWRISKGMVMGFAVLIFFAALWAVFTGETEVNILPSFPVSTSTPNYSATHKATEEAGATQISKNATARADRDKVKATEESIYSKLDEIMKQKGYVDIKELAILENFPDYSIYTPGYDRYLKIRLFDPICRYIETDISERTQCFDGLYPELFTMTLRGDKTDLDGLCMFISGVYFPVDSDGRVSVSGFYDFQIEFCD